MPKRKIEIKRRGVNSRKTKPVYLIIAEGKNKTETLYFSNYQKQGKKYSIKFVKAGNKTDAESLYFALEAKWNELGLSSDNGDKAFVVLDIDNDPAKATKVRGLQQSNKNAAISFVVSNPAFEIWFLLHFRYTTKLYDNADAVIIDLKKFIPEYDKNKDIYELCKCNIDDAINNSEKLERYHDEKIWPSSECNPRTDVGGIVKILEK